MKTKIMYYVLFLILLLPHNFHGQTKSFYNITDYGAVPDGKTLCTESIQSTIDECAKKGGGKVLIPAGKFLTGPLFLKSNIEIEICAGATLLGTQNIADYPSIEGRWEGIERKVYASLFTGHNLENIAITGIGILDGQGDVWWEAHKETSIIRKKLKIEGREPENPSEAPLKWPRPRMINLYNCKNVLIRDITILNSPSWTIHPVYCNNVTIENVSIIQPYESPNTDGINPESSQNVRIIGCYIDCGDDCIAIKSGYNEDGRRVNIPSENIVIANCTFAHGRSAIGIGSETSGGIRNVTISNCVFKGTLRGLRVKTQRGRGNIVENIRATNIIMEDVGTGISLDMFYGENDESIKPVTIETPYFKNIHYSQITGLRLLKTAEIMGLPEAPLENVSFTDVYLEGETGIDCKFVKGITFRNVVVNTAEGPSLKVRKSTNIELDNFKTTETVYRRSVVTFEEVENAHFYNCTASSNTDIFIEFFGDGNKNVKGYNNRFPETVKEIK